MTDLNLNDKQGYAFLCLNDNNYTEIGYGGGAGGGKSYVGCAWIVLNCLRYKETRYLIGRRELTNLKKTTLLTLFKVCNDLGLIPDKHYSLNSQLNIVNFVNGSSVILMDMSYKPSDPDYLRFGGLEITSCFVDESNECDLKSIEILKTRLGRCNNQKYNLTPKILETFNPSKNHVYGRYWLPFKNSNMPEHRVFIPALAKDNQFLDSVYITQLENADEVTRQRLLLGNFDFDDDDRALVKYNQIQDCFTNSFVKEGGNFISTDLAMQGRDLFVISIWKGLRVKFPIIKNKAEGKEIEQDVKKTAEENHVPRSKVVSDSDGLGSYLESYVRGIVQFHANQKPTDSSYANLKHECAFKLAELIKKGLIYIDVKEEDMVMAGGRYQRLKDVISEELSQLKIDNASIDKDQKKRIINKDEMKKNIGRSPDFLDCFIQRMLFEVSNTNLTILDSKGIL